MPCATGIGAGRGQRAVIHAGAGDDVGGEADIRRPQPGRLQRFVQPRQGVARHVRQDHVLLVADAKLAVGMRVREIGQEAHLVRRRIARRRAMGLERDRDDGVVGALVTGGVGVDPGPQRRICDARFARGPEGGRREHRLDPVEHGLVGAGEGGAQLREARLDLGREVLQPGLVHRDLDARLVLVVAPAQAVVDRHDRLAVWQEIGAGQEVADDLADHRRAAQPAADDHLEPGLLGAVGAVAVHHPQPDVVGAGHGPVVGRPGDGDLELARQELELRVVGGPLPQKLRHGAGIGDLVGGGAREVVGGDVADGVAAGLYGMQVGIGQSVQHVGDVD